MMSNKKGLSGIITMVLFVLLILAAIGIIWAFLSPFIEKGSQGVAVAGDCLNLNIAPISCVSDNTGNYNIGVKRGTDGSIDLKKVKFILTDSDGNVESPENDSIMGVLETKIYSVAVISTPVKVQVAGIITIGDSKEEHICEPLNVEVACTSG